MQISREEAARLGAEAYQINESGRYEAPPGRTVSIADAIERSRLGTKYVPPDEVIESRAPGAGTTSIEVRAEDALSAAKSLVGEGRRPVILNFASGTVAGGGYRVGARAQEESIARSSTLVPSLEAAPEFYALHRKLDDPHHTAAMIYSPDVVVYRDGETLLEKPWTVGVISAAAPRVPGKMDARTERAFRTRIPRILHLAAREGHDAVVLGAWGCGAYGNDPTIVAPIFHETIGAMPGVFAKIVFAIVDAHGDGANLNVFRDTFA